MLKEQEEGRELWRIREEIDIAFTKTIMEALRMFHSELADYDLSVILFDLAEYYFDNLPLEWEDEMRIRQEKIKSFLDENNTYSFRASAEDASNIAKVFISIGNRDDLKPELIKSAKVLVRKADKIDQRVSTLVDEYWVTFEPPLTLSFARRFVKFMGWDDAWRSDGSPIEDELEIAIKSGEWRKVGHGYRLIIEASFELVSYIESLIDLCWTEMRIGGVTEKEAAAIGPARRYIKHAPYRNILYQEWVWDDKRNKHFLQTEIEAHKDWSRKQREKTHTK